MYVASVMQMEDNPYIVSFQYPNGVVTDDSLNIEIQEFANSLICSLQFLSSLSGFTLSSMTFDLIHGHDNLWYVIDLKSYSIEAIDEKIREKLKSMGHETKEIPGKSPLQCALEDLKGFFLSEKPLTGLKVPYIDKRTLVDQSIQAYRRFSLPSLF